MFHEPGPLFLTWEQLWLRKMVLSKEALCSGELSCPLKTISKNATGSQASRFPPEIGLIVLKKHTQVAEGAGEKSCGLKLISYPRLPIADTQSITFSLHLLIAGIAAILYVTPSLYL